MTGVQTCALPIYSRRLKEVAVSRGIEAYLIDGPDEVDAVWLSGKSRIGVTAGASAPELLVNQVVQRIQMLTKAEITQLKGVEESVTFPLPSALV